MVLALYPIITVVYLVYARASLDNYFKVVGDGKACVTMVSSIAFQKVYSVFACTHSAVYFLSKLMYALLNE